VATRETQDAATAIVLTLLGGRLLYPPRTLVDRHYAPSERINLSGRPVKQVLSVTSPTGEAVTFQFLGNGNVVLQQSDTSSVCANKLDYVDVTYIAGVETLPPPVAAAVHTLACEMDKADAGEACSLPQRVTSVSRQGVSWSILDPQDFLNEGRTGLYAVDLVLSAYNRSYSRARARVFSPEFRPPIRLSETLTSELPTYREVLHG
jgi:hypothetical protein